MIEQLLDFIKTTGLANIDWRDAVMICVGISFIYLAIKKGWEPYELLPIGLGIIAANMPLTGLLEPPNPDSLNQTTTKLLGQKTMNFIYSNCEFEYYKEEPKKD